MRIAIVSSYYYPFEPGGAERSVRILAERLARDHDVLVVCLGDSVPDEVINGVRVVRMPLRNRYDPWSRPSRGKVQRLRWHLIDLWNAAAESDVADALAAFGPDLVHTNNLQGLSVRIWRLASRRNLPLVHTLRDYYLMCPATTMSRGEKPCSGRCVKCRVMSTPKLLASRMVGTVVGISSHILRTHVDAGFFADAASFVVYNAYELARCARRESGGGATLRIGFLGRLTPAKGIELFLAAAKRIATELPNAEFLIAGEADDEYLKHLRSLACEVGAIRFVGKLPTATFFEQVDMLVAPSLWAEPLGRGVLEAIVHDVPVVATPVGGIPELLEHGGGLLAAGTDVEALTQAMRQQIGARGSTPSSAIEHARRAQRFRVDTMADQYLAAYRSALERQALVAA